MKIDQKKKLSFNQSKVGRLITAQKWDELNVYIQSEIDRISLERVRKFAEKIRPDIRPPMENQDLKHLCELLNMRIDQALREEAGE